MRNHVLYSVIGMAALFLVNGCQEPVVEPPVLTMSTTEFTATAAGGDVTVVYKVANPVEGSTVEVVGAEEYSWVEVTSLTPSVVLTVAANDTGAERTAEFTMSYPGAADACEFTLVQAADENPEPGPGGNDFTLKAAYIDEFSYSAGESSDCFYFYLLEEPMTEDFGFVPGSACFVLDMYSAPGSNGVLPAGEYVLGDSMDPGVFNASNSAFTIYDEENPVSLMFTDGTISVSTDGENYTVDINVTCDDGESYHAVYNGPLDFGGGEPGAGYDFVLTESMYEFAEGYGYGGEDNYYLLLSDMPLGDGGRPSYGSTTYALDFYVEAGSTSGYELPEGNYPIGVPYATEAGTIGADYTYFYQFTDVETELYFTEGSVDVSKDGDIYTIEGNLTDTEGNTHHFTYTGAAFPEPAPLPESIEVDATVAGAAYVEDSDGVMEAILQLTDIIPDEEGYLYPPGTVVTLDAFMPYDEEGRIATGTYNVGDSKEAFTLAPGDEFMAMFGLGTYVADAPDAQSGFSQYYVSSGTVDISGSFETGYTVSCDLLTAEGVAVKCTYEGKIQIAGMPGPVSTLTGDHELALDGAEGIAYYYGDYFGVGGGNWMFALGQPAGGDGVQVDLVVDGLDFEEGIPTGTYSASAEPYPGKFMEGYIDGNYLSGTWYTPTDASGNLTGYAPAMEGTIDIVNNGDGSYDVTFDCTDDRGYVLSGSWSGELDTADYSYSMASTKSGGSVKAYASYPAKEAKTIEEKADIVKSHGFKLAAPAAKSLKAVR